MSTMEHHEKVRPYGPEDGTEHKFDLRLDAYVYGTSVYRCDAEVGSSVYEDVYNGCGWSGLVRGPIKYKSPDSSKLSRWVGLWKPGDDLNRWEIAQLTRCCGVIIQEDCFFGLVQVRYYDTAEGLDLAWSAIEQSDPYDWISWVNETLIP